MTTNENLLDQSIDIKGTQSHTDSLNREDEALKLGEPLSGQSGSSASISGTAPDMTVSGLTGMVQNSEYRFLTISGAASPGNNGTFLIKNYISATSVVIENASGVIDANNGSISWIERRPWVAEDDHNFHRTDRAAIKGVAYDAAIPTYLRCTDKSTAIPANLSNTVGKTTDAKAIIVNKKIANQSVSESNTFITVNSAGNLKHADAVNVTGIPVWDGFDAGNHAGTYVYIVDGGASSLSVLGGANAGHRIFGRTRAGGSTSPDAVEVEFRSVASGADISTSIAYTWEAEQVSNITLYYGERQCLDQLDEAALRTTLIDGIGGVSSDGGDGGSLPSATQVGQVLYSVDGLTFQRALPVTTDAGWIVTEDGVLVVNTD